ncbi:MAG: UDP-N-acetylmuramoyl-tripeptide--D-alanyl-D-alanine ligase [Candidatus Solibacter sp.]|nr:UDP-N-acetylmuramoyl-tripeptide--D-alanyl-D-alanine ligase [Candidatus Solibacter sp.]
MRVDVAGIACQGVSTDTRTLEPGQAYVALAGERHDGHDFVGAAIERGARAAVLARPVQLPIAQEIVADTLQWLQREAAGRRAAWGRAVVAVTGSAGKTTTKDAIAAALAPRFRVGKTQGNFNNRIGVPLSILNMPDTAGVAVLEIGMNHAGEIRELAAIARPEIAVVTNVGTAHIENFESIEGIAAAKRELVESLRPDGVAVLNSDDPRVRAFAGVHGGRVVTYGTGEGATVRAAGIEYTEHGARFNVDGQTVACPLPALGGVMACLAALAVARVMDVPLIEARQGLETLTPPKMRFERLHARGALIWNDCYNSNPEAAKMMIDLLAKTPARRRIAVLGEMLELGRWSEALHREVGEYAAESGIDIVAGVKGQAEALVEAAANASGHKAEAAFFDSPAEAGQWLKGVVLEGDAILFKGSRGTKVEEALAAFMESD